MGTQSTMRQPTLAMRATSSRLVIEIASEGSLVGAAFELALVTTAARAEIHFERAQVDASTGWAEVPAGSFHIFSIRRRETGQPASVSPSDDERMQRKMERAILRFFGKSVHVDFGSGRSDSLGHPTFDARIPLLGGEAGTFAFPVRVCASFNASGEPVSVTGEGEVSLAQLGTSAGPFLLGDLKLADKVRLRFDAELTKVTVSL